jgi:hypothetical protein
MEWSTSRASHRELTNSRAHVLNWKWSSSNALNAELSNSSAHVVNLELSSSHPSLLTHWHVQLEYSSIFLVTLHSCMLHNGFPPYMCLDLRNDYTSLSTLGVPSSNHAFNDRYLESLSQVGSIMHVHVVVEDSNAIVEP